MLQKINVQYSVSFELCSSRKKYLKCPPQNALYYVYQLAANCVCLPFGVELVLYSWFIRTFSTKKSTKNNNNHKTLLMREVRLNKDNGFVGPKTKTLS